MTGLVQIALLTWVVYLSVMGFFILWWVYAGYVARLVLLQGFWSGLKMALIAAMIAAALLDDALLHQSMALGIIQICAWFAVPAALLALVLKEKYSSVWFLSTLLALLTGLAVLSQATGLMQTMRWQAVAETFAHQGHMLFQELLTRFGTLPFVHWLVQWWLPLHGVLLFLVVLLAWHTLPREQRMRHINWGWSLQKLGWLWFLILLPKIVPVSSALEVSSLTALNIVGAMGLFGLITGRLQKSVQGFMKYSGLCAWIVIIVLWQWAIWVFAGLGSLVLWREGFNNGSNITGKYTQFGAIR